MTLEIRTIGLEIDEPTRHYLERRFQFALGRFAGHITRVSVSLTDLNGPRGGRDIRCLALVQIAPQGLIKVELTDESPQAVADRAADRAAMALARELERRRDHHRNPVSASGLPT